MTRPAHSSRRRTRGLPPLELSHVHKTIAGRTVLSDLSLQCPAGSITALLGPNGAGKTTTVTVAAGLRRPDAGSANVLGMPAGSKRARRCVSLVPQEIGFPQTVTIDQLLDFVEYQRAPSKLALPRDELYDALELLPLRRRAIGGLSGGQRRRVAVVAGFVRVPEVIILDEATTNLDETTRAAVWSLARGYVLRGGSVLATSHILSDIEANADRVVAITQGRVVLEQSMSQIRASLGGSRLSILVPVGLVSKICDQVAAAGLGEVSSVSPEGSDCRLSWRTREPLRLAALIGRLALTATELSVGPIPLGELLQGLGDRVPAPAWTPEHSVPKVTQS
jgi:ABC-2 type transport system ATP-binding protein